MDAGSIDYMPPEMLKGKNKNVHPGLDIWALGCMLFGMVAGTLPFSEGTNRKTVDKILAGVITYPPKIEPTLSREVKDLIGKMLSVEPQDRITITDVLNHPWMVNEKL